MARQAWQICRGTWRLNVGNGAVLWHRPDWPGEGIMTELVFAPGQRFKCRWVLVSPGSGARDRLGSHLPRTMLPPRWISPASRLSATRPSADHKPINHQSRIASRVGDASAEVPLPLFGE